jgi:hypothetical protein
MNYLLAGVCFVFDKIVVDITVLPSKHVEKNIWIIGKVLASSPIFVFDKTMLFLHLSVDFVVADLDGHYVIQIQNA